MKKILFFISVLIVSSFAHAGDSYLECTLFKGDVDQQEHAIAYFDRTSVSQVDVELLIPETSDMLHIFLKFVPGVKAVYSVRTYFGSEKKYGEYKFTRKPVHYDPHTVYINSQGHRVDCMLID